MRALALIPLMGFVMQAGGQPIDIPIENPPTELGYGATFSRDLGMSPAELQGIPNRPNIYVDGVYLLTFSVENAFPSYPGFWEAELSFGTQKLCADYGWGTKTSRQVTVVCPSPAFLVIDKSLPGGGPVQGSSDLVFSLSVNDGSENGGWPIRFQNATGATTFSLTFTAIN